MSQCFDHLIDLGGHAGNPGGLIDTEDDLCIVFVSSVLRARIFSDGANLPDEEGDSRSEQTGRFRDQTYRVRKTAGCFDAMVGGDFSSLGDNFSDWVAET